MRVLVDLPEAAAADRPAVTQKLREVVDGYADRITAARLTLEARPGADPGAELQFDCHARLHAPWWGPFGVSASDADPYRAIDLTLAKFSELLHSFEDLLPEDLAS